jgi:hypothetical protein
MRGHMFFNVMSTWKESLGLFRWSNFKLFLLVSLKTTVRALYLIVYCFWWLIVAFIVLRFFYPNFAQYFSLPFVFIYFLVLRPSLEPKNWLYFKTYFFKIWRFLLVLIYPTFIVSLLVIPFFMVASRFLTFENVLIPGSVTWNVSMIVGIIVAMIYNFGAFFVLDSPKKEYAWTSFVRGLKAVWFYAPFTFFMSMLFMFPIITKTIVGINPNVWLSDISPLILDQIFYIFCLSLIVTYYVKIKHSNRKLFFS